MIRKILAVVVGYLVMALLVMLFLGGAYIALGADRAFAPGTYEVTTLWLIVWGIASLVAALFGGIVCASISKSSKGAVLSLIILTAVLGAGNVVFRLTQPDPAPEALVRDTDTPSFEAMTAARAPTWVYITEPILGVVGIMLGAMIVCPKTKKAHTE